MQSYRLPRLGSLLLALLAVFSFGAIIASAAQAAIVEAPSWSIEGHRLGANETHYITAKAYTSFTLHSGPLAITCSVLKLKEGVLLGTEEGLPGKNDEVIEFSNCTTNITGCKVKEPIVTRPIKSELAEVGKSLVTEFFPNSGARFTTIELTPKPPCPVETVAVEGSVAGEVRVDPNKPPELGELVELGMTKKEAKSWLISFPEKAITEVCLKSNKEEACKQAKVGLSANTEEATLTGTTLILLANAKMETEEKNWSPLP